METSDLRRLLLSGLAIPALPLALDESRVWDRTRQRAVLRYYLDAGVGGIAVGVHSTHFDVVRAVMDAGREDIALYTGNDDNIVVELLEEIKSVREREVIPSEWLTRNAGWTDANASVFDAANGFSGVLCGIHEVLRRQGIFANTHCLNPHEKLPPGQSAELDRVTAAYPWLVDDDFVSANLARWLGP